MSWIASIVLWLWGRGSKEAGWNKLFVWLVGQQATRIWGGEYGAKVHGRKSRTQWLYPQWVDQAKRAEDTPQLWDDSGTAWLDGFLVLDLEKHAVVGQIEQAMTELSTDHVLAAKHRLAEVLRVLKPPTN